MARNIVGYIDMRTGNFIDAHKVCVRRVRAPRVVTQCKTLDRLVAEDARVEAWHHEGEDGYWVDLADGYNWEGCSTIHELSVRQVLNELKHVVEGECY